MRYMRKTKRHDEVSNNKKVKIIIPHKKGIISIDIVWARCKNGG
jgi:hypothetical protein